MLNFFFSRFLNIYVKVSNVSRNAEFPAKITKSKMHWEFEEIVAIKQTKKKRKEEY